MVVTLYYILVPVNPRMMYLVPNLPNEFGTKYRWLIKSRIKSPSFQLSTCLNEI